MPELPEITCRAQEMKKELVGKTIKDITVLQPKCLNISPAKFKNAIVGTKITDVKSLGKWIFTDTTKGWLLINLGMGGEILLVTAATLPQKHRVVFSFTDKTALSINFWWFGYVHYVKKDNLDKHKMTAQLGKNAIDVTKVDLDHLLIRRRGSIKSFLLNQKAIAGIGNAYVHDILWFARLHPLRKIVTLKPRDIENLAKAIQQGLQVSIKKGGAFYELNLYGKKGGFTMRHIKIGYKEGKPCPVCKTRIKKIKTGSTSTFICTRCQRLKVK